MPLDLTDYKSTMVRVMAWYRQATRHYLNQCWPRFLPPYDVTRPQWVNRSVGKCQHDNVVCIAQKHLHRSDISLMLNIAAIVLCNFTHFQLDAHTFLWGLVFPCAFPRVMSCLPPGRLLDVHPVLGILLPSFESRIPAIPVYTLWVRLSLDVWASKRQSFPRVYPHLLAIQIQWYFCKLYLSEKGFKIYAHITTKVPANISHYIVKRLKHRLLISQCL